MNNTYRKWTREDAARVGDAMRKSNLPSEAIYEIECAFVDLLVLQESVVEMGSAVKRANRAITGIVADMLGVVDESED